MAMNMCCSGPCLAPRIWIAVGRQDDPHGAPSMWSAHQGEGWEQLLLTAINSLPPGRLSYHQQSRCFLNINVLALFDILLIWFSCPLWFSSVFVLVLISFSTVYVGSVYRTAFDDASSTSGRLNCLLSIPLQEECPLLCVHCYNIWFIHSHFLVIYNLLHWFMSAIILVMCRCVSIFPLYVAYDDASSMLTELLDPASSQGRLPSGLFFFIMFTVTSLFLLSTLEVYTSCNDASSTTTELPPLYSAPGRASSGVFFFVFIVTSDSCALTVWSFTTFVDLCPISFWSCVGVSLFYSLWRCIIHLAELPDLASSPGRLLSGCFFFILFTVTTSLFLLSTLEVYTPMSDVRNVTFQQSVPR